MAIAFGVLYLTVEVFGEYSVLFSSLLFSISTKLALKLVTWFCQVNLILGLISETIKISLRLDYWNALNNTCIAQDYEYMTMRSVMVN